MNLKYSSRFIEVLGLLLIFAVTVLRVIAIDDLGLWDESIYLGLGVEQSLSTGQPFTQGGTYFDAYWITSKLLSDPLVLYYFMRVFSAFVLVLAVWLGARLFAGARVAWSVALVAALLPVTRSWPGVGNFGAALCLVAVVIAIKYWSARAFIVSAVLMWLAAGARPEYLLLAVIFTILAAVSIIQSVRHRSGSRSSRLGVQIAQFAALVVVPILLILRHGSPTSDGGRNWVAFTQHFALRSAQSGEDPWLNSAQIAERFFGNEDSVLGAALVDPGAVTLHFVKNIATGPMYFVGVILPIWWKEPGATLLDFVLVASFLLVALTLVVLSIKYWKLTLPPGSARKILLNGKVWLVITVLVIAASPIVFIYPRIHFFGVLVGAFLVGLAVFIERVGRAPYRVNVLFVTSGVIAVLACTSAAVGALQSIVEPPQLLRAVQALRLTDPNAVLLTADSGIKAYLPELVEVTPDLIEGNSIEVFLESRKISAILLNDRLKASSLSGFEDFQAFLEDPTAYGFDPVTEGSELLVTSPQ